MTAISARVRGINATNPGRQPCVVVHAMAWLAACGQGVRSPRVDDHSRPASCAPHEVCEELFSLPQGATLIVLPLEDQRGRLGLVAALRAVQEKEAILRRAADAQDSGDGAASALAEADALHVFAGQIRSLVVDVPSEESEPMKTP